MKDPEHPVGPPFWKAADAWRAWREQQKALLDQRARDAYEQIRRDAEAKRHEILRRQEARRLVAIEEEKKRLLLEKPNLALRMLPSQRMRELLAYHRAVEAVRRQHETQLQALDQARERNEDAFLKQQQDERERAKGASERSRAEFNDKAALDRDALAEALHRRAAAKERERDRDRGDGGRER